jgi:7-carboxy-7-deazaguanine synthase
VLRVAEVYASTQGEGPRTGQATVFVRFGGCNLRCPGWPCDTQHAIDPAFRAEWERLSPSAVYECAHAAASSAGARVITLTGGEPFLQPSADLQELCSTLAKEGYQLEAFTNGTLSYPNWAINTVSMIVDWKLPGSGEYGKFPNVRIENLKALSKTAPVLGHAVKFVCKDMDDLQCAIDEWKAVPPFYRERLIWYYGKVWKGNITDAELVEAVLSEQLPWRLNLQTHQYIWPPNERRR